tara:strand:- start:24044 stop:26314 length:2271 start_codon:yes stop_codon:yes gene_type:complete
MKALYSLGLLVTAAVLSGCHSDSDSTAQQDAQPPNILFIVLDDVGVDQLQSFGYGGLVAQNEEQRAAFEEMIRQRAPLWDADFSGAAAISPALTPSIDAIADQGVRFRNTWAMPTCSPSRATFFEGRYPFRTNVRNAIVTLDLANSQVSPYEITTPRLLRQKGYVSAVVGKMHLSGSDLNPDNNPLGDDVMRELGWDYFDGYLDGGPYPIDTSAGGVGDSGDYPCGFVPNTRDAANGADQGICHLPGGGESSMSIDDYDTPGQACLEQGGVFVPTGVAAAPDFDLQNGYYTGDWIINNMDGSDDRAAVADSRSRGYRTVLETDRALDWLAQVREQQPDHPWMLSVGYSAIHTPLQPPPRALLPSDAEQTGGYDCTDLSNIRQQRVMTKQMLEAMDHEIRRLLIQSGVARTDGDSLQYDPHSNTVVIIVGDNGTYAPSVRWPFDPTRSKGFPYQTGVWVPLIVAGPMVNQPDRDIGHLVNSTDLYSLFAEIAGIDLEQAVPAERDLDAQSLLPYLTEPVYSSRGSTGIRDVNYTEMGANLAAAPAPPCVIPSYNVCVQIFPQQEVCEDQGGSWYGPGSEVGGVPDSGFDSCCAVNAFLDEEAVDIMPTSQRAIRNAHFKLVQLERPQCEAGEPTGESVLSEEFYSVNEETPVPEIDRAAEDLLADTAPDGLPEDGLDPRANYAALKADITTLLASAAECPGDGNLDQRVDQQDLANWQRFSTSNNGMSSWYDFNHDGHTDEADKAIIDANFGNDCRL